MLVRVIFDGHERLTWALLWQFSFAALSQVFGSIAAAVAEHNRARRTQLHLPVINNVVFPRSFMSSPCLKSPAVLALDHLKTYGGIPGAVNAPTFQRY